MGDGGGAYKFLVRRPDGKRLLGRIRYSRWEDNIKMDLQEVAWGGMIWLAVTQDTDRWRAFVNVVLKLWVQ
jgi:hypothetical protein